MIDSVLKGTGNSRFLKSAVPAGTSWADALAMLQAGTFPIDFNGINTEGFQQVGTPLNKANLLKDATAAQIGLPPSTTPDDMFQALGNTGELHVWRKTVKNATDVPAGYNLGVKTTKTILNTTGDSGGVSTIYYSSSVSVSDSGEVSLKNPASTGVNIYTSSLPIVGKFFYIVLSTVHTSDLIQKKIYFVPSGTDISVDDSPKAFSGVVQEVTGYAKIPAGTTTTYPVSTNPNAYQEGDDAKAAGYVVGDVVTGQFKMGLNDTSNGWNYGIEAKPTVNSDGTLKTLKLNLTTSNFINASNLKTAIAGKFVQLIGYNGYSSPPDTSGPFSSVPGPVIFVPTDVNCTVKNSVLIIDRYQPVTGYAAIPAGTTIEYLGKLGDKARVQVLSYVGTGTYGSSNPCSLTFDFAPKVVRLLGEISSGGNFTVCSIYPMNANYGVNSAILFTKALTTTYKARLGFSENNYTNSYCKISQDGKTITWYNTGNDQINTAGYTYYFLALG